MTRPEPPSDPAPGLLTHLRQVAETLEEREKRAQEEIRRLNERESERARFMGTVIHELSGPITLLHLRLHALHARPDPAIAQELDGMQRSVSRLERLLRDLRTLAGVAAGGFTSEPAPTPLRAIVDGCLEDLKPLIVEGGKKVVCEVPPELAVHADAMRIHQVITNLLTNADRHTTEGGRIDIAARVEGVEVVVTVTDDGAGIPPEKIGELFRPFVRLEKTNGGTGLGLYICKTLVEDHRGRMWCESDGPGWGARFSFTLPLATRRSTPSG